MFIAYCLPLINYTKERQTLNTVEQLMLRYPFFFFYVTQNKTGKQRRMYRKITTEALKGHAFILFPPFFHDNELISFVFPR